MGRESMMPTWILSPLFCSQGPVAVCVCGRCCKHNKEHSTQCNQAAYISYRYVLIIGSLSITLFIILQTKISI